MSNPQIHIIFRRALLVSALTALVAAPAIGQDQAQLSANSANENGRAADTQQQDQRIEAPGISSTTDFRLPNPLRGETDQPAERSKEKAIIERSFEGVDLRRATRVQAGTTTGSRAERERRELVDEVPQGTGVIVKDGKVIAQTQDQQQARKPGESTPNRVSDEQPKTEHADESQSSARGVRESRGSYQSLKGTSVVNSTGQDIGTIEDIVIDSDSGDTSLVIATESLAGTSKVRVFAPLREVTIIGTTAVWDTFKTRRELQQSDRSNEGLNDTQTGGSARAN